MTSLMTSTIPVIYKPIRMDPPKPIRSPYRGARLIRGSFSSAGVVVIIRFIYFHSLARSRLTDKWTQCRKHKPKWIEKRETKKKREEKHYRTTKKWSWWQRSGQSNIATNKNCISTKSTVGMFGLLYAHRERAAASANPAQTNRTEKG